MPLVSVSRKHHVSMGNYEWVEFGVEVNLESDEYESVTEALISAREMADEAILGDIEEAVESTAEADSYIHLHPHVYKPPVVTNKRKGRN